MNRTYPERLNWIRARIRELVPSVVPDVIVLATADAIVTQAFVAVGEDDAEWFRVVRVFSIGMAVGVDAVSAQAAKQ